MAKKNRRQLNKQVVKKAIEGTYGNLSHAAQKLGVSRQAVYNYVNKHDDIKELLEQEREAMLDIAENNLFLNVQDRDNTAIIFLLKTQGKKRGYIERAEIEHSGELKQEVMIYLPDNGRGDNG